MIEPHDHLFLSPMNPLTKNDLLEVLENTTLAQLRALRALRRSQERNARHRSRPEV